jgi:hypothetical protein
MVPGGLSNSCPELATLAALGYVEYLSDFYFQIGIKLRFQYYEC